MAKAPAPEMKIAEVDAPIPLESALQRAVKWAYEKRLVLSLVLVAILVLVIVLGVMDVNRTKESRATSAALAEASYAIGAMTGEDNLAAAREAGLAHYADEAARRQALNQGLDAYLAAHAGHPSLELALLAKFNLALTEGKAAEALSGIDSWLNTYAASPVLPLARELKARAQLATGDRAGAIATLDALAKASGPKLATELYIRLGDLHHPALNDGKGDAQAARTAYEAARALLPALTEPENALLGKPGLHGRIDTYLELLP